MSDKELEETIHHARQIAGTICTDMAGQYVNEILKVLLKRIDSLKADLDEALDVVKELMPSEYTGPYGHPGEREAAVALLSKHGRLPR